ncbi:hypothetical protein B9Z55_011245 [Caenorhabditis nigoni]|uniref:Sdz-33 F-box domain-containing protein n=1 Tax=Caenorhabditis nigoni TaxID=1611254 RepID=A0A2G5UJ89_9PELO|nr:hypothetical protein B9Z55_011245 [Caenorhabditis nigoni]
MTNLRFPLRLLPSDLDLMVLKTMEYHEIIAFSFLSKKSLSLVKSLRLSLEEARINICKRPDMYLDFGNISVLLKWKMGKNDQEMTSFDDVPLQVDVSTQKIDYITMFLPTIQSAAFTWSNQKKSIREWIQHLCSIFQYKCQKVNFYTGTIRFDIQSLRNTFPKLEEITIYGSLEEGPSDHDIQSTQIILKAFLPYVQNFHLRRVPLNKNLTIQHIGMANSKELVIYYPRNLKLENLLILNVERYTIDVNQFHLRDLNRFLKLWTKGANSKLKYLLVHGNIETIPAGSVLLKGLQVEEEDEEDGSKLKYTIRNCHGICAQIQMLNYVRFLVSVEFTVLN